MSHKEILEKAIQKAIDGGWNGLNLTDGWRWGVGESKGNGLYVTTAPQVLVTYLAPILQSERIIFDHSFAKALWGEGKRRFETGWRGHLQRMVISEDPIKYLGENI